MNGNPAELVLYVQAFPEVKYFSVVFMVQCYSMDFYAKKTFVAKTSFEALRVYSAWKEETFDKTGDIITKKWCEWNDFNIKDYRLHTSTLSTMLNAQEHGKVLHHDKECKWRLWIWLLPDVKYFSVNFTLTSNDDKMVVKKQTLHANSEKSCYQQYQKYQDYLKKASDEDITHFAFQKNII